jgi:Mg2+ and Co2+ transporter CorA
MTMQAVLQRADPAFEWEDVVAPTEEELNQLAQRYGLEPTSLNDCLDPEHLPKFEQFERYAFAIIRAFDERSGRTCTTVPELTRKVAIFYGPTFLLTVHRRELAWLTALQDKIRQEQHAKPVRQERDGLRWTAISIRSRSWRRESTPSRRQSSPAGTRQSRASPPASVRSMCSSAR